MSDAELIKKLARRIHNQRVALRENWMIVEMRATECAAEIYRGRRRLNIKWWNLVKSRGNEIQSLQSRIKVKDEALREIHETSGWLMVSSFHSKIAEGLRHIREVSEKALPEPPK